MYMHVMAHRDRDQLSAILQSCACHKVRLAARAVTRAYDEALRPSGLRATQLSVLVAIGAEDAISITALAQVLGMDRSTLKRNLTPLEAEGLVALGEEGWRRSRNLVITAEGRKRLQDALPLWKAAQTQLRERLNDEGWSKIQRELDHLIAAT